MTPSIVADVWARATADKTQAINADRTSRLADRRDICFQTRIIIHPHRSCWGDQTQVAPTVRFPLATTRTSDGRMDTSKSAGETRPAPTNGRDEQDRKHPMLNFIWRYLRHEGPSRSVRRTHLKKSRMCYILVLFTRIRNRRVPMPGYDPDTRPVIAAAKYTPRPCNLDYSTI